MTAPQVAETTPTSAEEAAEAALLERINNGELIEDMADLTPRYRAVLERTLNIAATSEVTVLTWAHTAYPTCPDLGAKIAVSGSIQDEVGHAHQQGMLLERFGFNMQKEAFERDPKHYISLPILEHELESYIEFVTAQSLLDRSGRYTTWDIELHCSFAPYRRALRKVNFEEAFHYRHGAMWVEYYWNQSEETRAAVQKAVDWLFPWGYHWYGRPDHLKGQPDQLTYGVRKWTNDTMREKWLQNACKFAAKIGFKVPAHYDEEQKKYVYNGPFPAEYTPEDRWTGKTTTWDKFVQGLKDGGPMRPACYERLQVEEWGDKLWQS